VTADLDDTIARPRRPLRDDSFRTAADTDAEDTVVLAGSAARVDGPARASVSPGPIESFYRVSIGTHSEPIALDRPCVVGRRPSAPRIPQGPAPRLVRVASPLKEVSSTHLEVRQLGSSVIVTDLRSTNGSVVMVPGSVPRKLRQGESVVVSPGTLVDIGDDNIIQILPIHRQVDGRLSVAEAGDRS
jgi:pSer/pThr/pTyr-binding forkhead associated (FHA) protein